MQESDKGQKVARRVKRKFQLPATIASTKRPIINIPSRLQFVFISIDIDSIRGTIASIERYIDFVDSYIIVTSSEQVSKFETLVSLYPIVVIDESSILEEDIVTFQRRDHQTKNWMLRASLLQIDILHDIFIMLDDDNRAIREIPIEHFFDNGRYQGYYYYNLDAWDHSTSDYDLGQHNTRELLLAEGFQRLSYSSHKPQIIDKAIFQEVVDRYYTIGVEMPIDEWSVYFNYAMAIYPELFEKRKFDVLNWPDHPSRWDWVYRPDEYNFENYYEELYTEGLFSHDKELTTAEKIALKEKEVEPYIRTHAQAKEWQKYFDDGEFLHKILDFPYKSGLFTCYDLPYYQEANQGSWLKIPMRYKALSIDATQLQLTYYLNGDLWYSSFVDIKESDCCEGRVDLLVDCRVLERGFYRMVVDVIIEEQMVYVDKSPYLMGLRVV